MQLFFFNFWPRLNLPCLKEWECLYPHSYNVAPRFENFNLNAANQIPSELQNAGTFQIDFLSFHRTTVKFFISDYIFHLFEPFILRPHVGTDRLEVLTVFLTSISEFPCSITQHQNIYQKIFCQGKNALIEGKMFFYSLVINLLTLKNDFTLSIEIGYRHKLF